MYIYTQNKMNIIIDYDYRLYADKDLFDKYIADCIKYQTNVC